MLLFGFFIGTGAGIFHQKDWGSSTTTTPDHARHYRGPTPWGQTNDPVMGGQSTGAFTVSADGVGPLEGSFKIGS